MTKQMQAVLLIATQEPIAHVLLPVIDQEREAIHWDQFSYGVLSGGQKAAISWIYAIWTDGPVPQEWRDPFEGFGVMSETLQGAVIGALALRHGVRGVAGESVRHSGRGVRS